MHSTTKTNIPQKRFWNAVCATKLIAVTICDWLETVDMFSHMTLPSRVDCSCLCRINDVARDTWIITHTHTLNSHTMRLHQTGYCHSNRGSLYVVIVAFSRFSIINRGRGWVCVSAAGGTNASTQLNRNYVNDHGGHLCVRETLNSECHRIH